MINLCLLFIILTLVSCNNKKNEFITYLATSSDRLENKIVQTVVAKIQRVQYRQEITIDLYSSEVLALKGNINDYSYNDIANVSIGVFSLNSQGEIIAQNHHLFQYPEFSSPSYYDYYIIGSEVIRHSISYSIHLKEDYFQESGTLYFGVYYGNNVKTVYEELLSWTTRDYNVYGIDFLVDDNIVTFLE